MGPGCSRTIDGGDHWEPIDAELSNLQIRAVVLNPQIPTTYVGTTGTGVFKSTDGGAGGRPPAPASPTPS
jgi:hypothetical protein